MSVVTLSASSDNQRSDLPTHANQFPHTSATEFRPSSRKDRSSDVRRLAKRDTGASASPASTLPPPLPPTSVAHRPLLSSYPAVAEEPPPHPPVLAATRRSSSSRKAEPWINDPATPTFSTPLHDDVWFTEPEAPLREPETPARKHSPIRALSFDKIFGLDDDAGTHPTTTKRHVRSPAHEEHVNSNPQQKRPSLLVTPKITIAPEHASIRRPTKVPVSRSTIATIDTSHPSSSLSLDSSPPPRQTNFDSLADYAFRKKAKARKPHLLTVDPTSLDTTTSAANLNASWSSAVSSADDRHSRPTRRRRPSVPESRIRVKPAKNSLASPRSQTSTTGTRSAASSHRSGRSSGGGCPRPVTRDPAPENALARQRTQFTGPGFASLPPSLARSPTSKLLTQKSAALNDAEDDTLLSAKSRIDHTPRSVSSTLAPLSPADGPLSQSPKSSTLQSIPESHFHPESNCVKPSAKKSDNKKLLFKRIFGGDSLVVPSDSTKNLLSLDSNTAAKGSSPQDGREREGTFSSRQHQAPSRHDYSTSISHSHSAVEEERKTFGRRALSIIGIGNKGDLPDSLPPPDFDAAQKRPLHKRVSLRTKGTPQKPRHQKDEANLFHRLKSTLDHYSGTHPPPPNMGNTIPNCCGGRPDSAAKDLSQRDDAALNFLAAQGGQTDLDKFDRAYAEDDIATLVALVNSKEVFEQPAGENLHPWAETPKSVGALATTQLAALASVEEIGIKERIRVAGAIPLLVEQLSNPSEDRRDAALVALSFLSIDYARACMDMFEAGVFIPLIELLKSDKVGVRAAAAQTARNIYVLEVRYRRAFRDSGGCQPLVDLLDLPPGKHDSQLLDIQLEAVYHIDDFIMFNGEEVSDCIAAIKVCNTARKLEFLQNVEQSDLKEAARQLFLRVAE